MSARRRVCLVTGASRGLGKEAALQLARMGAFVYLAARDAESAASAEAEFKGMDLFDVRGLVVDLLAPDTMKAAAAVVDKESGRLDSLINNAGILIRSPKPPSEVDPDDLRATINTNLIGSIMVTQAFLPLLKRSEAGRIVNVTSGLGSITQCADPHYEYAAYKKLAYSVSKAGLNAATVMFASELAGTNVKINSADPGHCATDLNNFTGRRTAAEGAAIAVRLATLSDDGPTGGFFDDHGRVPW